MIGATILDTNMVELGHEKKNLLAAASCVCVCICNCEPDAMASALLQPPGCIPTLLMKTLTKGLAREILAVWFQQIRSH